MVWTETDDTEKGCLGDAGSDRDTGKVKVAGMDFAADARAAALALAGVLAGASDRRVAEETGRDGCLGQGICDT